MPRPLRLALVVLGLTLAIFGMGGLTGAWCRAPRQGPSEEPQVVPFVVKLHEWTQEEREDPPQVVDYPSQDAMHRKLSSLPPNTIYQVEMHGRATLDLQRKLQRKMQQTEAPPYDTVTVRGVLWGAVIWVGITVAVFSAWPRRRRSVAP